MKGRMIHLDNGKVTSQLYGLYGECINSVDRQHLNTNLLDEAENHTNVHIHFEHELSKVNFATNILTFEKPDGSHVEIKSDLIIGADGINSRVRGFLQSRTRMDISQKYIDHSYIELSIPRTINGEYAMDPNHLHIWPRKTFMMIALPNPDKSFTVTLFMPVQEFEKIKTDEEVIKFFKSKFPDAISIMGVDLLLHEFRKNPLGSLAWIKCYPHHYGEKVILIGDAAHAMVPFYGQGMNCGFEDALIFFDLLKKNISNSKLHPSAEVMRRILSEYTQTRAFDTHAIVDLALHNYEEMRNSVTTISYILGKKLMGLLAKPFNLVPVYTMVSFSRTPYSKVVEIWHNREKWLRRTGWGIGIGLLGSLIWITKRIKKNHL
ncbi:hypothetical protein HK096_009533 [Nowakowskiella sp. JEL0078]|nr:hypothetical protein HK096_009533 [Nowakowskiella sp. JEL0078]